MPSTLSSTLATLSRHYRVGDGSRFRLSRYSPNDTNGLRLKDSGDELLDEGVARLADLQERLYAQDRWSVLLIFQRIDDIKRGG